MVSLEARVARLPFCRVSRASCRDVSIRVTGSNRVFAVGANYTTWAKRRQDASRWRERVRCALTGTAPFWRGTDEHRTDGVFAANPVDAGILGPRYAADVARSRLLNSAEPA